MSSNIVQLKVNDMAEKMSNYIIEMDKEENKKIPKNSFMFWGAPGVGKSESILTIKNIVEEVIKKTVIITDVRLLLFNPVDLRGIPVPDINKEFAIWLRPQIFNMDPNPNIINILMLDEISAAPPSVQAAAYQLTLDRKVGEHKLPDNCFILAAGNRMEDKSVVYKMPKALANRLIHFDIVCDLDDWKKWALKNGIDARIIGFLNYRPNLLQKFDSSSDDNAFPTPRTWSFTNNFLKIFKNIDHSFDMIAGAVGLGTAHEFKTYCKVFSKLPSLNDIFNGKDVEMPKEPDILFALSAAISSKIDKADKNQLSNVIKFITIMPKDFAVLTVKDMLLVPGIKDKMIHVKEWIDWTNKNSALII